MYSPPRVSFPKRLPRSESSMPGAVHARPIRPVATVRHTLFRSFLFYTSSRYNKKPVKTSTAPTSSNSLLAVQYSYFSLSNTRKAAEIARYEVDAYAGGKCEVHEDDMRICIVQNYTSFYSMILLCQDSNGLASNHLYSPFSLGLQLVKPRRCSNHRPDRVKAHIRPVCVFTPPSLGRNVFEACFPLAEGLHPQEKKRSGDETRMIENLIEVRRRLQLQIIFLTTQTVY